MCWSFLSIEINVGIPTGEITKSQRLPSIQMNLKLGKPGFEPLALRSVSKYHTNELFSTYPSAEEHFMPMKYVSLIFE